MAAAGRSPSPVCGSTGTLSDDAQSHCPRPAPVLKAVTAAGYPPLELKADDAALPAAPATVEPPPLLEL